MLDLYLMTFSKRENSTLIPTASQLQSATVVSVALKGGCDILNPTFILESSQIPAGKNYAKFQDRYYFITGISSVRNNLVEITARVDVLGSWKSAIQSMSAFVAYDETANTEIVDKRLSVETSVSVSKDSVRLTYANDAGTAIIMVQGEGNNGIIELPLGNLDKLTDVVYTKVQQDLNNLPQQVEEFWKYFITQIASQGQAGDNIKGAYWYPWLITSTYDQSVYPIMLGSFATQYGGTKINEFVKWDENVLEIPWQFSDWRNNEPYTELYLYMPYVGEIKLTPSELIGEQYITVTYGINRTNGNIAVSVERQDGCIIYTGAGSSGFPLPVGSSNIDTGAIAGSILQGAAATAFGISSGNAVMAAGGFGSIIGAGLDALLPHISSMFGSGGSAASVLSKYVILYTVCHDTNVDPSSVSSIMGTPTMATKSLSGLTGYVQTVGASVSGGMLDTERAQINKLLDRGIYIE